MRRTAWSRIFSVVMGAWLALSLSEPPLLHSCPLHGAASDAHVAAHRMSAHGGHHGDRSHGAPTPARHDNRDGGKGHACTCLGHCCCVTPVGLAGTRLLFALGEMTVVRDTGLPAYQYVPVAAEHLLPFPNGPPALT